MIYTCKPTKVSIYDNRKTRYTAAKVKAITGADIVFNGGLFDRKTYAPYCVLKIDGIVKVNEDWVRNGIGWNDGEIPKLMSISELPNVDNFIACITAVENGAKVAMSYPADMGGRRGRTAFGMKSDGSLVIACTCDGNPAITMEETQDKLLAQGCVSGIILDGGGSSQIISPVETIASTRIVSNFICVWLAGNGTKKEDDTLNIIQPNYKWAYGATRRTKTDYIVLHHVGAKGSFAPEQIHAVHLKKGWRGIGYNFYVRKDGTIYHGREENAAGGHTLNYNQVSIGICFEGNFETETMPEAQLKAGKALLAYLRPKYPNAKIVRHRDLNATACPGKNFPFAKMTVTDPAVTNDTIYRVQVGAFFNKKNAENLMAELTAKGYKPYITTEDK